MNELTVSKRLSTQIGITSIQIKSISTASISLVHYLTYLICIRLIWLEFTNVFFSLQMYHKRTWMDML